MRHASARRAPFALTMLVASSLVGACSSRDDDAVAGVLAFGGPTMGSGYQVKFVAADAPPVAEVRVVVERVLDEFDRTFSNWRSDSEIARVNAHRSVAPIAVSARFAAVLQQALDVAVVTDGAYDPTVKPLTDLFRGAKAADGDGAFAPAQVEAALARVDHTLIRVEDGAVHKARADVELDLDGIVAGAAADAIAVELEAVGVRAFFLSITGETLCRGSKPSGVPWRVGVEDPAAAVEGRQGHVASLPISDRALCSSGDYQNRVVVDGRVVHHVFDPRTGRNPPHNTVSASVLADSCAVADALATALLVGGEAACTDLSSRWQDLGVHGALLLLPAGDEGGRPVDGPIRRWRRLTFDWPGGDG